MTKANGQMSHDPVKSYAPPVMRDPVAMANLMPRAVEQISETAALAIEQHAAEIEAEAKKIADGLRELAAKYRDRGKVASDHVMGFCEVSVDLLKAVEDWQLKLVEPGEALEPDLPRVVSLGPVDLES